MPDPLGTSVLQVPYRYGEVSERLKEHGWNPCSRGNPARGFESPPLRFFENAFHLIVKGVFRWSVPVAASFGSRPPARYTAGMFRSPKTSRPSSDGPLVLLVGHCGFDSGGLERAVRSASPEARVESVNNRKALEPKLGAASLLLINRQLDGSFGVPTGEHGDGIELVRELSGKDGAPPCIVISNFPEAQQAAEEAGALPGFGKKDVRGDAAVAAIRASLEAKEKEPS